MVALSLDTHEIVKELKEAGFDETQAEALSRVLTRAQDVDLSHLVTKADLKETALQTDAKIEMTKADLRETRLQLEAKIESARADMIKWMFGTIGFQTVVILGAVITLARGITH